LNITILVVSSDLPTFFFRRPGLELSKVCLGVRPAHDLGLGATAFPGLFAHGAGHLQGMAVSQLLGSGSPRIPRSVAVQSPFPGGSAGIHGLSRPRAAGAPSNWIWL